MILCVYIYIYICMYIYIYIYNSAILSDSAPAKRVLRPTGA